MTRTHADAPPLHLTRFGLRCSRHPMFHVKHAGRTSPKPRPTPASATYKRRTEVPWAWGPQCSRHIIVPSVSFCFAHRDDHSITPPAQPGHGHPCPSDMKRVIPPLQFESDHHHPRWRTGHRPARRSHTVPRPSQSNRQCWTNGIHRSHPSLAGRLATPRSDAGSEPRANTGLATSSVQRPCSALRGGERHHGRPSERSTTFSAGVQKATRLLCHGQTPAKMREPDETGRQPGFRGNDGIGCGERSTEGRRGESPPTGMPAAALAATLTDEIEVTRHRQWRILQSN